MYIYVYIYILYISLVSRNKNYSLGPRSWKIMLTTARISQNDNLYIFLGFAPIQPLKCVASHILIVLRAVIIRAFDYPVNVIKIFN